MLSVIAVVFASVIVLSIVKVLKLQRHIDTLDRYTNDQFSNLYRNISHEDDEIRKVFNDQIKHVYERMDRQTDDIWRRTDELNSYVDRRFDKLIDTYMLVKETEQESKKIIKG